MTRGNRSSVVVWLEFAALYAAITVAYAWPMFEAFATRLPNDTGDPGLNAWIMWWNAQALPLTARWWNAPIFYPMPGALALSESLLGMSIVTTPLLWAGATPIVTYNIAFLLSYLATALAAHALAWRLTGRHDAALVAGLAFAFSPYRSAQVAHLQVLWAMWMPICLLALHRYVDHRRARDLVIAGGAWLMNALSCGYYLAFFPVLVALWMIWFVRSVRDWLAIGLTLTLSSLPLVPLLLGYRQFQSALGLERFRSEIETFSADPSGIWSVQPSLWPSSLWTFHGKVEGELYPGIVILILGAVAMARAWRRTEHAPWNRFQKGLAAASLVSAALAFAIVLGGPWRSAPGGVEISLSRPGKAFFVSLVLLACAWLSGRRFLSVWQRRSPLFFYPVAAVVMLLFAFGPDRHLFFTSFQFEAPYSWLMSLPGGSSLRAPARFGMLMVLCLATMAALAFARLTSGGAKRPIVALVATAVVLEGWLWPFSTEPVAQKTSLRGETDLSMPVIEVPFRGVTSHSEAMVRATAHRHPLFNGYSGYVPTHFASLESAIDEQDPAILHALQQFGPLFVIVNQSIDSGGKYARYVSEAAGPAMYRTPFGPVYRLPRREKPERARDAVPLAIDHVAVNSNQRDARNILDGDLNTRWQTHKPQSNGDEVVVVFPRPVRLARLEMDLGAVIYYYPRHLRITVADAGQSIQVWEGRTAGLAFAGALADHGRATVVIDLPASAPGRRFVLEALEQHWQFPWSIAEFRAFGWPDDGSGRAVIR